MRTCAGATWPNGFGSGNSQSLSSLRHDGALDVGEHVFGHHHVSAAYSGRRQCTGLYEVLHRLGVDLE